MTNHVAVALQTYDNVVEPEITWVKMDFFQEIELAMIGLSVGGERKQQAGQQLILFFDYLILGTSFLYCYSRRFAKKALLSFTYSD